MTLADLLAAAGLPVPAGGGELSADRVIRDSRLAGAGAVFVAIRGLRSDGHAHAAAAVAAGAVAVVAAHPPQPPLPERTPLILVEDPAAALARLAAVAAGDPSRRLTVAGITGTDGKTTTTTMLHAAWRGAGLAAAALTTVDFRVGDRIEPNLTRLTTLGPIELQDRMARLLDEGISHVAIETSSHALAQRRTDAVAYRVAIFTRITSEHLDYHGTWEEYRAAKLRLAAMVASEQGVLVGDADDVETVPLLAAAGAGRLLTYSGTGDRHADLVAEAVDASPAGVRLSARTPWGTVPVELRLAGRFNAANALAALAAACTTGAGLEAAAAGLGHLDRVTGRMERVDLGQPFTVVVDYAHTADALARVLSELRPVTAGRLWAVFGSAGERDRVKRPAMGRVAAELADRIVLCDEDPRGEDRHQILAEIAAGARAAGAVEGRSLLLIADRAEAIAAAIGGAQPGDTVLCAGKGHEASILGLGEPVAWDERAVAEAAVRAWLAGSG